MGSSLIPTGEKIPIGIEFIFDDYQINIEVKIIGKNVLCLNT